MFNIENFPEIIMHLKTISSIFKKNSAGWYEMFCPYCDDSYRKLNPSSGHFFINSSFPFGHCFRCQSKVGLDKLLIQTGFKNQEILDLLTTYSKFNYHKFKSIKKDKKYDENNLNKLIIETHYKFLKQFPDKYYIFKKYIYDRCCDIDILEYNISPTIINNYLAVQFINYDGNLVTTRFIDNPNLRYLINKNKKYYYFQNIDNIYKYNNIVICEGIIDLINLSNYLFDKNNTYFIAMCGSHYKNTVNNIINSQLLIGNYTINIIFDQGLKFINNTINNIKIDSNILNPDITVKFYLPTQSKDVSECMSITEI